MASFTDVSDAAGTFEYDAETVHPQTDHFRDIVSNVPGIDYYGAVLDDRVVGRTAVVRMKMNFRSAIIDLTGIGMVLTDMLHKKERVCKTMLKHFIDESLRQGVNIQYLSPFRPDFYKKMGFGYGSTMYRYRIPTASIPSIGAKSELSYFTKGDRQAFLDCYSRHFERTHGEVTRIEFFLPNHLGGGKRTVVRRRGNGIISGALVFTCGENRELIVNEMIYEDVETLHAFCAFLHSQADEFHWVLLNTPDEYLYYLFNEGTNGLSGIEIGKCEVDNMFRISNVAGLFADLKAVNFNDRNITVGIHILDSFVPANQGRTVVQFIDGYSRVIDGGSATPSVEMTIDVSNFSSLMVGAIDVAALHRMGLITLSDDSKLDELAKLFALGAKPLCTQHV